ncbi:MAG: hypothetical protein LBL97_09105, partial [Prevotellaceae bacterium]|nr:hypothetical protein [Prevotellaceae bacterium]
MEEKKELDESNKRFMKVMEWTELPAGKFATSIGATQSSISHITSGRNKPGMSMLNRIRENYPEINFEWLLTGNGSMLAETDEVIPSRENDYSYGSLFSTP